jgi:CXXX repeat modification system protein
MNNKVLVRVTESEKNEALLFRERRNGLLELLKCNEIPEYETIHDNIVLEIEEIGKCIRLWWEKIAENYEVEYSSDNYYVINFITNEISSCIKKESDCCKPQL